MSHPPVMPEPRIPQVVGSFGNAESLAAASIQQVREACDLIEIRLDLLEAEGILTRTRPWAHLTGVPLLFTARRGDEGGAGNLSPGQRMDLLEQVLGEAALVDVELASATAMAPLLAKLREAGIPWVASWHDFEGRADSFERIPELAAEAAAAGAACFKAALRLHDIQGVARLAELQQAATLPLALMGMGPLAPVSRLLCAQHGAVLNYGYLGNVPTAPGQWSASLLKQTIATVTSL
ncbi:type I 3-dehydroquinate dehydratase [Luteolibacter sp. Populi]|uniref:type I 3-dehydroquinate dehydratase n=1 Tax=Luteolibacter sp. Populi TaxID=3230487 RepID=UPI003465D1AB